MRNKMDERQVAQDNKIMAEVARVLMSGLLLIIILKTYLWNVPPEQILPDFNLLIGASVYSIARRLMLGSGLFGRKNPKVVMPVMLALMGVTVTLVQWLTERERYAAMETWEVVVSLGIFLASYTALAGLIYAALWFVDRRRQRAIEKKLDE